MIFIETSVFSRHIVEIMTDEEYRKLQSFIMINPDIGVLIRGSGGLRKIRWDSRGHGKSGGARIIYYWATRFNEILMLCVYAKNEMDDLSLDQLKIIRQVVEQEYYGR
jgi:mRNA-degrading endonuclease RelE of RelBE toxin-antitoxin system